MYRFPNVKLKLYIMNEKFSAEFERRLFRLEKAIANYRLTGNTTNVLPFVFQCLAYAWAKSPKVKSKTK